MQSQVVKVMPFFSSRTAGVPSRLIEKRVLFRARTASAVRFSSVWIAPRLAPGFSCSAPRIEMDDASRQSRTSAFLMFVVPETRTLSHNTTRCTAVLGGIDHENTKDTMTHEEDRDTWNEELAKHAEVGSYEMFRGVRGLVGAGRRRHASRQSSVFSRQS